MIKYLGSKRTLVPLIVDVICHLPDIHRAIDLFSGTARVGHALKRAGYQVLANDHNAYAATLARCYVQADAEEVLKDARRLIAEFNAMTGVPGYFTETFCVRSRFFHPRNGERIDSIREAIAAKSLPPDLEAVLLVSLMEAADRVDSTTGVQMAYLKDWAPRAHNDLKLRAPDVLPRARHGKGIATCLDAQEATAELEGDVAYIDPPYNQHSYLSNYHIWESLVRWDKPSVYGVACKRADCRERKSAFNSRRQFQDAFRRLLHSVRAEHMVISFNNEGYLARADMESILSGLWDGRNNYVTLVTDYKRYVGAQIGIYNPDGVKVGKVTHLRNKEFLYVVSRHDIPEGLVRMAQASADQLSLPF